jgi:hypothetical protein
MNEIIPNEWVARIKLGDILHVISDIDAVTSGDAACKAVRKLDAAYGVIHPIADLRWTVDVEVTDPQGNVNNHRIRGQIVPAYYPVRE